MAAITSWVQPVVYFKINGKQPPVGLRLLSFELDQTGDMQHKMTMVFENRDRRLENPELGQWLQLGNLVSFSHGFLNRMAKPRNFEIKGHAGFEEFSIICYPKIANSSDSKKRTFKDTKYSSTAKLMAAELKLKKISVKETDCKEKSLSQNDETNLKFLADAARKLNFEFGAEDDEMIFRPYNFLAKPQLSFFWRGGTLVSDILKFEPDKNIYQVPGAITTLWTNPETGKTEEIKRDATNTPRPAVGGPNTLNGGVGTITPPATQAQKPQNVTTLKRNYTITETNSKTTVGKIKLAPVLKPSRSRKKNTAACKTEDIFKINENQILKAKLTVLGEPFLKDKMTISLFGLGPFYDGSWYVKNARHKIGAGASLVECDIMRNAQPQASTTTTRATPSVVDLAKPPASSLQVRQSPQTTNTRITTVRTASPYV